MTVLASDSFTGTPTTSLTAQNANWIQITGLVGVAYFDSTGLRIRQDPASGGTVGQVLTGGTTPSTADYSVSADLFVSATTAGGSAGVVGRCASSVQSLYHGRHLGGTGWQIVRYLSGTASVLSTAAFTVVAGTTYNLRLDMVGTTLNLYVDGVLTVTTTDSNLTASGLAGIRFLNVSGGQYRLENYSQDQTEGGTQTYSYVGTGGLAYGGTAPPNSARVASGSGGAVFSGTAEISTGTGTQSSVVMGSGGVVFLGTSPVLRSMQLVALSGLTFSGSASPVLSPDPTPKSTRAYKRGRRPRFRIL